jgi:hypothetical protein
LSLIRRWCPYATLATVVAVNLVLLGAYVWSRGGQQTRIRVEARGDDYTAYVDGRWSMSAHIDGPDAGGIALLFEDQSGTPTLPAVTLRRIRVTDLATGETLLDDRFEGPLSSDWRAQRRVQATGSGLRFLDGAAIFLARPVAWRDIAVELDLRNVMAGSLVLHTDAQGSGVQYHFGVFRHLVQSFSYVTAGTQPQIVDGGTVEPARAPMVRSMLAMLLAPYPLLLAALIALTVIAAIAAYATPRLRLRPVPERAVAGWRSVAGDLGWYATEMLALAVFLAAVVLIYRYTGHAPNWPDSVSYVFQSKVFASARIAAPAPPNVAAFDFFYPPLTVVNDGRWASIFPFGHPLLLAPGELLGVSWLMPPLAGAASVVLLFAIARRWYGTGTALVASLLLATSPFFLMQSSNYMSHVSALLYLLAALACIVLPRARIAGFGMLAGIAFGLLFNTRPLTAAVLAPAFALLLLPALRDAGERPAALRRIAGFAAGGVVMLLAYAAYNYGTTGDPFSNNYFSSNQVRLGFGGAHSVSAGIQNDQTQLAYLLLVLNGWPTYVGLALVLAPFVLGTRDRHDWFCLFAALSILVAYTAFSENGIMQGPRLWYEAVPFLLLLAARSVELAAQRLAPLAARSLARADGAAAAAAVRVAGYALVAALCGAAVWGWLLGRHPSWKVEYVPETAQAMRNFNGIDDRLQRIAERQRLDNALVLVTPCPHWQCYGNVFWRNSPSLDGRIVWAKDVPEANADVMRTFPDREVWIANYNAPFIVPWGTTVTGASLPVIAPGTRAPRAREILAALGAPITE